MEFKANHYNRAEIMRIIREWTELSQKDFAERIGKSRMTVQAYERNLSNYNIDTLLTIAKEFNLEIIIRKKKWSCYSLLLIKTKKPDWQGFFKY